VPLTVRARARLCVRVFKDMDLVDPFFFRSKTKNVENHHK